MKRILALILALSLALTVLSGCALKKKLTAFGLYSKAVNTIREAGGMEAECEAVMDLSILSVTVDMNIKLNGKNSEISVSMGDNQVTKTTIVDGMTYLDTAGVKTCYPTVTPENSSGGEISAIPKLAEDLFNDIEIVEDENGNKELTVTIGADVLASLFNSAGDVLDGFSFDDAELTMYFNADDEIESMHVEGDAKMDVAVMTMTAHMMIDYRFINLGTAPKISIPEDADDYILVDMNKTENT